MAKLLVKTFSPLVRAIALGGAVLCGAASAQEEDASDVMQHVSCRGNDNEIRVRVTNVESAVGLMVADLYPEGEENFLRGKGRIAKIKFAAKAPVTAFCLQTPAAGNYALAVYHDENANNTFDKKAFGLPDEPFGISNNPRFRLRAPTNAEALFEVASEGTTVEIKLRN